VLQTRQNGRWRQFLGFQKLRLVCTTCTSESPKLKGQC
jgi:hypothetical protein